MLSGMKIVLEITILAALNLFLFGYVQRKMIVLAVSQRNQIIILKRSVKKPKLKERDRVFWMFLSRTWADWKEHLIIVKPETVIRWQLYPAGTDERRLVDGVQARKKGLGL